MGKEKRGKFSPESAAAFRSEVWPERTRHHTIAAMFDSHLNTQHRLDYMARGPEWAFAVPAGDLDALEEVMALCSGFWNGTGSLMVPVSKSGRFDSNLDDLLEARPVECCWLHPSLSAKARAACEQKLPSQDLHESFDETEVHPLLLANPPTTKEERETLPVPRVERASQRRLALALWGAIPDTDLPHWRDHYEVVEVEGVAATRALVDGQTGPGVTTPLRRAQLAMNLLRQVSPWSWPTLFVFSRINFRSLINFWNLRSRTLGYLDGAQIAGIPKAALADQVLMAEIRHWATSSPFVQYKPDILVAAESTLAEELETALGSVGFEPYEGKMSENIGGQPEARAPLYGKGPLLLSGRLLRGVGGSELIALSEGRSPIRLAQPGDLKLRGGHRVRVALRNLPTPLPITTSAAAQMTANGVACEGLMVHLASNRKSWDLDLRMLDRFEALRAFATDKGEATELTQDGRYAEALLRRVESVRSLDVLADANAIALLRSLAPQSRPKLTRRLLREVEQRDGSELSGEQLSGLLREIGIFLELGSKSSADLASELQITQVQVLATLEPLIELGLVTRGRSVRCPECRYRAVVSLEQLAERLRCEACGHSYALPVRNAADGKEPRLVYRLDGLMARVMDQDLLPVLLALRAMDKRLSAVHFFAWPGVQFTGDQGAVDVDLLCSDGNDVHCFEVKDNASSLEEGQLNRLFELADRLEARPGVAGLRNSFAAPLRSQVQARGGLVLEAGELGR